MPQNWRGGGVGGAVFFLTLQRQRQRQGDRETDRETEREREGERVRE